MKLWMRLGLGLGLAVATASAAAESIAAVPNATDFESLPELSAEQLARVQALIAIEADDWSEVEALRREPAVRKFEREDSELLLAANGRYAWVRFDHDWHTGETDRERPVFASVGRASQRGDWLELWPEAHLNQAAEIPAEAAKMPVAFALAQLPTRSSVDQAIDFLEEQMRLHAAEMESLQFSEGDEAASEPEQRLLRVRVEAGELLLEEGDVAVQAQAWSGQGPLWMNRGLFWSKGLQPSHAPVAGLYGEGFLVQDPLASALPATLKSMLRVDAIEARVVETVDDPAKREWSWGSTRALYRIDKGARDGLHKGMELRPLSDEGGVLTVETVEHDSAIVALRLHRFSPKDSVVEPRPGDAYTSRKAFGQRQACGIDTSAAVRALITEVRPLDEGKADAEGFVWFEIDIDHGRRHGLELEQALSLEGGSYASGESRLRRLEANSATLLWRVHTGFQEQDAPLPVVGGHVVTPAWQRASEELFGF
jgi:hypothetical protein